MIKTTYRYIMDNCDWEKVCEIMGWNEWMINEGLCDDKDECELTFEEAQKIRLPIKVN